MIIALAAAAILAVQTPASDPAPPRAAELAIAGEANGAAFDDALSELRARAQAGDSSAQRWMGSLTAAGFVAGPPDGEVWLRRAMDTGDQAQRDRAALTLAGQLSAIEGREAESRALLESLQSPPADIQADAAGYLGADYLFGHGGEARPGQGEAYLNSAITLGFDDASVLEAYADHMIARDGERAMTLMRRAAEAGGASAAWRFAMMWLEGGGDAVTAFGYVDRAAAQGHLSAQISRAVMLATGQGVDQDLEAARAAYRVAARRGSAHAVRSLGAMYAAGEGGPVDAATGYALLELAAAGGDPGAASLLDTPPGAFARRPAEADINAAARTWLAEHGLDAAIFQ